MKFNYDFKSMTELNVMLKANYPARVQEELFNPIHRWEVEAAGVKVQKEFVLMMGTAQGIIPKINRDGITGHWLMQAHEIQADRAAWKATKISDHAC